MQNGKHKGNPASSLLFLPCALRLYVFFISLVMCPGNPASICSPAFCWHWILLFQCLQSGLISLPPLSLFSLGTNKCLASFGRLHPMESASLFYPMYPSFIQLLRPCILESTAHLTHNRLKQPKTAPQKHTTTRTTQQTPKLA